MEEAAASDGAMTKSRIEMPGRCGSGTPAGCTRLRSAPGVFAALGPPATRWQPSGLANGDAEDRLPAREKAQWFIVAMLCLALSGCQELPWPGTFAPRKGDEIVAAGQFI